MEQDTQETLALTWDDSHPWLSRLTEGQEEDSVDEVIRYTLDELRFA